MCHCLPFVSSREAGQTFFCSELIRQLLSNCPHDMVVWLCGQECIRATASKRPGFYIRRESGWLRENVVPTRGFLSVPSSHSSVASLRRQLALALDAFLRWQPLQDVVMGTFPHHMAAWFCAHDRGVLKLCHLRPVSRTQSRT